MAIFNRKNVLIVVGVLVLGMLASLCTQGDSSPFSFATKKENKEKVPVTTPDGTPVTSPDGSIVYEGDAQPTTTTVKLRPGQTTTTQFVLSREDEPEEKITENKDCRKASPVSIPVVLVASFVAKDGDQLSVERTKEILEAVRLPTAALTRLGQAFIGTVGIPGTNDELFARATRLAQFKMRNEEKPIDVAFVCEGHPRNGGSISVVLKQDADPKAVIYRNGFRDEIVGSALAAEGGDFAIWEFKTEPQHTVRRSIAYLADQDVLAVYPGRGCPTKPGDPSIELDCGLKIS